MITKPEINLRAPEPDDLQLIYSLEEDPRMWIAGTSAAPVSKHLIRMYLDGYRADFTGDGELRLVAVNDMEKAVGLVDLFEYDKMNRRAGVGIAVLPAMQRQGYGRAMLMSLTRYARERFLLHSLWAQTAVDNTAAVRAFAEAGYQRMGVLQDWLFTADGYKDVIMWQLQLGK